MKIYEKTLVIDGKKALYSEIHRSLSTITYEGYMEDGMDIKQVYEKLKGPFGGGYKDMGSGRFRVTAYTD